MNRRRRVLAFVSLLVIVSVIGISYVLFWPRTETAGTAVVRRGAIQASFEALGRVQPRRQLALSLRTGGMVERIAVVEGQSVAAGALLLELNAREQREGLQQAQRALEVRKLQLEQALQAPSGDAIALARARLRKATAARIRAQRDYDQVADQPDAESSDEAFDLEVAKLEYETAQAEFDGVMEGAPSLEIRRLQADVEEAALALRQAEARLEEASLKAPFPGTIMRIDAKVGENVYGYSPLIVLADLAQLEVLAEIDELDIPEAMEGQKVLIRLDAFPTRALEGQLARLRPGATEGSGTTTYRATVAFDGGGLALRPGMGANLTIVTRTIDAALLVPRRAIRQVGRHQVVRLLAGRRPQEVIVTTGLASESEVQILTGIEEGQVVLLD